MKNWLLSLVIILSAQTFPKSALAEEKDPFTIQALNNICKEEISGSKVHFCLGYLIGISHVMALNGDELREDGKNYIDKDIGAFLVGDSICTESSKYPSGGALMQAYVNWASKHPEKWNEEMMVGAVSALRETWPCTAPYIKAAR